MGRQLMRRVSRRRRRRTESTEAQRARGLAVYGSVISVPLCSLYGDAFSGPRDEEPRVFVCPEPDVHRALRARIPEPLPIGSADPLRLDVIEAVVDGGLLESRREDGRKVHRDGYRTNHAVVWPPEKLIMTIGTASPRGNSLFSLSPPFRTMLPAVTFRFSQ